MPDDFDLAADGKFDDPEEPEELESTDLEAAEGGEAAEEPGEPEPSRPEEGGEEPAGSPAEAGPEDWQSHLRPGETPQQAVQRLAQESSQQHGRAASHWSDLKALRDEMAEIKPKISAAERLFAAMQKKQEAEERAAFEKEMPDPELEPERYQAMLLRSLHERLSAQEEGHREREVRERWTKEQQAHQQRLQEVDDTQQYHLNAAVGQVEGVEADEEAAAAIASIEAQQWNGLVHRYGHLPGTTEKELLKAHNLMRKVEGRHAAARGMTLPDYYKAMFNTYPESVRREWAAIARQGIPQNGHQEPQKAGGKKAPSPQEIEAQAAKAGKGAGVRRTSGGGSVAPPATFEDFAALPEHEQARILEEGKVDEAALWADLSDPDWG